MASPQVADAVKSLGNAHAEPVPAYRVEDFARAVGVRLRDGAQAGQNEALIVATLVQEQKALVQAMHSAPLLDAAALAFQQALTAEQNNAHYQLPLADARAGMESIFINRARDAHYFELLLADPAFITRARQSPLPTSTALPPLLTPDKAKETVDRLVQSVEVGGPEPVVHVQAAAQGHQQFHQALANLFAPEGPLQGPLQTALQAANPTATQAATHAQARDWLEARSRAAQAVADGMKPTGALYEEAVQQAKRYQVTRVDAPPSLAGQLKQTSGLSPVPLTAVEREAAKTRQQKAEDVIYTLNHAITCLSITDAFVAPLAGAGWSAMTGKHIHIGCGADGHDHKNSFALNFHKKSYWSNRWASLKSLPENITTKSFWSELGHNSKDWLIGEFVGDMCAVPLTIITQRFAPGFMHGLRKIMEPVVGGIFHRRAETTAQHWGVSHNVTDKQEITDRAEALYNYEMEHLSQMAVWTADSIGLNYGTMYGMAVLSKKEPVTIKQFAQGKVLGAALTAITVFGARILSPNKAHWWDEHMGEHVIIPVTKKLGGLVGIRAEDVDHFHHHDDEKSLEHAKPATTVHHMKHADKLQEADRAAPMLEAAGAR